MDMAFVGAHLEHSSLFRCLLIRVHTDWDTNGDLIYRLWFKNVVCESESSACLFRFSTISREGILAKPEHKPIETPTE